MKKPAHGFTLIELMVVVAIIAILSIIGIVSFTNIQSQARDGRRRADIDAIATAMEANRNPTGSTYPTYDASIFANNKKPYDPLDTSASYAAITYNDNSYIYTVSGSGTSSYIACARLEKNNGNSSDTSGTSATGTSATYYCRKSQQ